MQSWAITNKPKSGPYHNLGYYRVLSAFTHLEFLTKLFEVVPTDEYTSDVEEGLMDFGSPLPAHS